LKYVITLAVVALFLTACASNGSTQSGNTVSSADGMPGKKKVCTHERNSGGVSRMKRVCTYVDIDEADAS
jgi:hypothetical protein